MFDSESGETPEQFADELATEVTTLARDLMSAACRRTPRHEVAIMALELSARALRAGLLADGQIDAAGLAGVDRLMGSIAKVVPMYGAVSYHFAQASAATRPLTDEELRGFGASAQALLAQLQASYPGTPADLVHVLGIVHVLRTFLLRILEHCTKPSFLLAMEHVHVLENTLDRRLQVATVLVPGALSKGGDA